MQAEIKHHNKLIKVDLSLPIDISIPLRAGEPNVNAWYVEPVKIEPVKNGDWVGDVNQGGSVNFRNITFNPHGNGTHTECVGHISKENYTINQCLKTFFFLAELVSIEPEKMSDGDLVITLDQLQNKLKDKNPQAIIIRTLPNADSKMNLHYSNTNPPYIHHAAAQWIHEQGIDHLLIDLPSVDKENDEGKLLAHHIFWQYPNDTRLNRTITEMIYVPDEVVDGAYLLNLQIASFENDASPSKPIIYKVF